MGADDNTYRRPVSPTEAWFLVYPESLPGVIQVAIEGAGHLDPDDLVQAVKVASAACPGARLTRHAMTWVDTGVAPAVRVRYGQALDPVTFADVADLHRPLMGDDGGPTCEVLLLTGPPITVVFRASHAVMDGKGVLIWVNDVFRALRGEVPLGAPSRITETDLLEQIGTSPPAGLVPDLGWPSALGPRATGSHGFFWRRRTVDGTHPALVAKLALAITQACGSAAGRFRVPVDLRRYDTTIRSSGNLTHNPLFDVRAQDPWEVAHERLLTMLATGEDLAARADPLLVKAPREVLRRQLMTLDAISAARDRYASLATLSHVGRLDLGELSTAAFHATTVYSLPNSGPVGPPELNLVECGGRTEITIGWYDLPATVRRAEELLEHIADALSPRTHRHWSGNRTDRPLAREGTVVHQFAEQVAKTPHAVALTGPEGEVTYAELDRRANTVAAELRARGVGPGVGAGVGGDCVVGLVGGRTVSAVAAIWGVLKTGAAYLPLDPQHPDHRIRALMTDAGTTVCLTERRYANRRLAPAGCATVVLENLAPHDETATHEEADATVRPEALAYVIYTSGSTGRPKGVEIEHSALATFVSWATQVYGVDASTRFPLFTSLAFDLSNTAIFLPLLVGGSIVLVAEEPNHVVLREMLDSSGANALKLTPTHLDLIGRLGLRPTGFRVVIAGGELLRGAVAARAQDAFGPGCRIFNEYGPTETTIGCMSRMFDPDRDGELASVPIGLPTDNTRIHLLDADRRFVAPGQVGEMYLAGAQLARGYRGRPDLDRERFVTLADGTRAYRSGDLARMLASGELESVGRNDEQVKVLGYRIEPAEVARVLEEHPAVARAFVLGRTRGAATDKSLCAYVVPRALTGVPDLTAPNAAAPNAAVPDITVPDTTVPNITVPEGARPRVSVRALEEHVRERLPSYMVPASTTFVAELPRTDNGKVDVAALPDPFAALDGSGRRNGSGHGNGPGQGNRAGHGRGSGLPAPGNGSSVSRVRDDVEEAVAAIWARTLTVDQGRLGGNADFHQLGGDSATLLAMLAAVCGDIVGTEREKAFMSHLGLIIRRPTLEHVCELARQVRAGAPQ